MVRKKKTQVIKSRGEVSTGGLTIKEWQRTPKQLLSEFCQRERRPKPIYRQANIDYKPRCRIILRDPKNNKDHDIVLTTDETYASKAESEHAVALLALHKLDGNRQHDKKLPEPYQSAWLALSGRSSSRGKTKTDTAKETEFCCKYCGKSFKKEHGMEGHIKKEHKDILASEAKDIDGKAGDDSVPEKEDTSGFDLFPSIPPSQKEEKAKPIFRVSSTIKHASKHERMMAQRQRTEVRAKRERQRNAHKLSNPYASVFMSDDNRKAVEDLIKQFHKTLRFEGEIDDSESAETLGACMELGFNQKDIRKAITHVGSSKEKVLDWLLLNLDERSLPKNFDPKGKQFEVFKNRKASFSSFLERFQRVLYNSCSSKSSSSEFEEAVSLYQTLFQRVGFSDKWPSSAGTKNTEEADTNRKEELLALEAIFQNNELREAGSGIDSEGNIFKRYVFNINEQRYIPAGSSIHVLLLTESKGLAVYPDQAILAFVDSSSFLSDEDAVQLSLEITLHCIEKLQGSAQLYEIWEYGKQLLIEYFEQKWTKKYSLTVNEDNVEAKVIMKTKSAISHSKNPPKSKSDVDCEELSFQLKADKEKRYGDPKYQKMQDFRNNLPAFKQQMDILHAINDNKVTLISGETGCGKTTQIPQYILDSYIDIDQGGYTNIICTQPRRLAAIGVAKRVADERCENLGGTVGYQIRLESRTSYKTRLCFVTTGILLRRLQGDHLLSGVSHIIVDEVHERNVDSDFLLAVLKKLLEKRSNLKLILMSATLEASMFATYFSTNAIIKIPGFVHPVKDIFLEEILEATGFEPSHPSASRFLKKEEDNGCYTKETILNYLDKGKTDYEFIASTVLHIHRHYHQVEGSILIFMSGAAEIKRAICTIEALSVTKDFLILPLHGALSAEAQAKVFTKAPPDLRKVVVSTNVAETSLTIDDVVFVVDSGRIKEIQYDAMNRMSKLVETWVSRNSARQRRGRAGRVKSGFCFKLYSKKRHDVLFNQSQTPEIRRVPLEQLVLQVLDSDLGEPHRFMITLIEPPSDSAVAAAVELLKDVGAIRTGIKLTQLGKHLAALPMDVRVAKMLVFGTLLKCSEQVLTIAASMSTRSPFLSPPDKREEANEAKTQFLGEEDVEIVQSDHICLLYAYERFLQCKSEKERYEFCRENFLSFESMKQITGLRKDFRKILNDRGFTTDSSAASNKEGKILTRDSVALVKAAICAGLYPNVVNVLKPLQKFSETQGGAIAADPAANRLRFFIKGNSTKEVKTEERKRRTQVYLHPSSVNFKQRKYPIPWMVYHEKVLTSKLFIRDCTVIPPYCLLFFGGGMHVNHEMGTVQVDDWIILRAQPRIAVLVRAMKDLVEMELQVKFENPSKSIEDSRVMTTLRNIIVGSGFS